MTFMTLNVTFSLYYGCTNFLRVLSLLFCIVATIYTNCVLEIIFLDCCIWSEYLSFLLPLCHSMQWSCMLCFLSDGCILLYNTAMNSMSVAWWLHSVRGYSTESMGCLSCTLVTVLFGHLSIYPTHCQVASKTYEHVLLCLAETYNNKDVVGLCVAPSETMTNVDGCALIFVFSLMFYSPGVFRTHSVISDRISISL